jgi:hypothetical protein
MNLQERKMNSSDCVINRSEEKKRKHWLFAISCFLVLCPLALLAFFAILSHWVPIPDDAFIEPLAYVIVGLFSFWLFWHCAYKKYGTKLLTCWLIISPFKTLSSIMECLKEPSELWVIALILLNLSIFLWCFSMSIKMRALNKTVQERLSLKKANPIQA